MGRHKKTDEAIDKPDGTHSDPQQQTLTQDDQGNGQAAAEQGGEQPEAVDNTRPRPGERYYCVVGHKEGFAAARTVYTCRTIGQLRRYVSQVRALLSETYEEWYALRCKPMRWEELELRRITRRSKPRAE